MAVTDKDAESLADKLTAMELTDAEREALNAVFAAASTWPFRRAFIVM